MTKKALILGANLVAGNFILFNSGIPALQNRGDEVFQIAAGFSISAITILLLAFRWLKPQTSFIKVALLSALVSFFVPLFGLPLFFLIELPVSLEVTMTGLLIGALFSVVGWKFWFPMWILNMVLFRWLTKLSS